MPPENEPRPGGNQGANEGGRMDDQAGVDSTRVAGRFLQAIHGSLTGFIEVRLIEDRRGGQLVARKWYSSIDALVLTLPALLELAAGHSAAIFFGVLARGNDRGGREADVLPGTTLWVDLDFKDFPGGENEAREGLTKFPCPPSILVRSGHGLHAYWLLREPAQPHELKRLSKCGRACQVTPLRA